MELKENDESRLTDFIRLNEEWISRYFEIEEVDRALAKNPYKIIAAGGYIFSLILADEVVGVCALFNHGDGTFELARMAVPPKHQGKGFGNKLIDACLKKLLLIDAESVYLVSNTKLKAAIELYRKYGFKTVSEGSHPEYSRANIVMERRF
jgi:ribosomal protein S18 acetylase RimI-like enzyme